MKNRPTTNRAPDERQWPAWLEPLRPDEMTRRRLRTEILAAATPLLRIRAGSWQDVAAGWSSVLVPLAAAIALVFGTLAHRAARSDAPPPVEIVERAEWERLLGPAPENPPAFLTGAQEPSREAVFTAAIAFE